VALSRLQGRDRMYAESKPKCRKGGRSGTLGVREVIWFYVRENAQRSDKRKQNPGEDIEQMVGCIGGVTNAP
jgi:hypothetical protein